MAIREYVCIYCGRKVHAYGVDGKIIGYEDWDGRDFCSASLASELYWQTHEIVE